MKKQLCTVSRIVELYGGAVTSKQIFDRLKKDRLIEQKIHKTGRDKDHMPEEAWLVPGPKYGENSSKYFYLDRGAHLIFTQLGLEYIFEIFGTPESYTMFYI